MSRGTIAAQPGAGHQALRRPRSGTAIVVTDNRLTNVAVPQQGTATNLTWDPQRAAGRTGVVIR